MCVKVTSQNIQRQDMDESCTFDKDDSELVLMMTEAGVSSERETCMRI